MKLTAHVKLLPTPKQGQALRKTLECANAACNYISEWAWEHRTFGQWTTHRALYHTVREQFGLSAQLTVRCIAKVADAYKLDRQTKRVFRPTGSIAYDERILRWRVDRSQVSIWTLDGRQTIPFVCGDRQRQLLATQQGETDLAYRDGLWLLFATCNVEEPEPVDVSGYLGCDLGIVNILTDSDGTVYAGAALNGLRHRHRRLRKKLQTKGTKSACRLLKKRRNKEARFARQVNHTISKRIVAEAQRTSRGIAIEDLRGIRQRVRVRRPQRATLHSWSFLQLGQFLAYKAQRVGVPLVSVNPRNTSRQCPACGYIAKHNRPSQSVFLCAACGHSGLADHIAAINIGRRAVVSLPHASDASLLLAAPGAKPTLSSVV